MAEYAIVDWSERVFPFAKANKIEDEGEFYAVFAGDRVGRRQMWEDVTLLYIGLAYRQPVVQRIKQDHQAYDKVVPYLELTRKRRPNSELLVKVGGLVRELCSVGRVTEQFATEVENLLIFRNRPRFNVRGRDEYTGRHLMVINTGGHAPLRESSSCCSDCASALRNSGELDFLREEEE